MLLLPLCYLHLSTCQPLDSSLHLRHVWRHTREGIHDSLRNKIADMTFIDRTLKTCPGQNYSITYDYNFGSTAPENPCLITLIYPAGTKQASTITGNQDEGVVAGQWAQTGALFQGVSDSGLLSLVLKCGARGKSAIGVDNVVVKPYDGDVF